MSRIDYTEIDDLLKAGWTRKELVNAGYKDTQIHFRRDVLGKKGTIKLRPYARHRVTENPVIEETPFIPPPKRQELAQEAKRRRLGMDRPTFERVWLPAHIWTADRGFVEARG